MGRYGLDESINQTKHWRSDQIIGLSVAPVYQAVAALDDSTAFATDFVKVGFVQKALHDIAAAKATYGTKGPALLVPIP